MNNLIKKISFSKIGNDNRGITSTFKLCRKQDDFVFLTRKAGSISGNTYHKGLSQATSPKVFILLSGSVKFSYRKTDSKEVFEETINEQTIIEVSPSVTHQVEALTDVIFLEGNSIDDIVSDRQREDVYIN